MNRRKLYTLASAFGLYLAQDNPNMEMEAVMTSIIDDVKEPEEQLKKIVIDEKIANDKYNKEQMKYRKRFHK